MKFAALQPSGETGYWNTDYLQALKDAGSISEFHPGADWGGQLNGQNKGAAAYRIAVEQPTIYGTAINFTACFSNCESTELNFNLPDFGVLAAESGCKTCG